MGLIKRNFFIVIIAVIFFLSLITDWYNELTVVFLCVTVITILDKLGKGIVLRELIVLHAVFACLLMPVIGYEIYNKQNHLARIFYKFMPVPRTLYFSFVLPAVSAFAFAICWPITKNKETIDEGKTFQHLLNEIKKKLQLNPRAGIVLISIGIVMSFIDPYLPIELKFVGSLFYSACFAGMLYTYYAPAFRRKTLVLVLFTLFILYTAVQSGVFTIVAYMGITLFSFFFVGRQQKFWKKLLICLVSIFFLFLIQNIKSAYRHLTWKSDYEGNKTEAFTDIAITKFTHLDEMIDVDALFPIYTRLNQGFNIALVMRRIPTTQDFDDGKRLMVIGASSLVPRVLWPDKPQAGGKESMMYFTGINIVGFSTNVSPIGEAYGSFGVEGGIFFMFVLGLFIRWVYRAVFMLAKKTPLLALWIPVLFFQVTYSMETDTLQILNSLFKSAFFVWMLTKVYPAWFGIVRKNDRPVQRITPNPNPNPNPS